MTLYFFDTSAIAKRYLHETGTHWVRNLIKTYPANRFALAATTPAEISSLLARRWREGNITSTHLNRLFRAFDRHAVREYVIADLTAVINSTARQLLVNHPLRAADALQLGSALVAEAELHGKQPFVFVCADVRLHAAATQEGLTVDDPNNHP